jgi:hypothetical protein
METHRVARPVALRQARLGTDPKGWRGADWVALHGRPGAVGTARHGGDLLRFAMQARHGGAAIRSARLDWNGSHGDAT